VLDSFLGTVAVVTGGASGIGFATARALAREGAAVVLADVEDAALERAAAQLRAEGAEAVAERCDVGDLAAVRRLAERTFRRFGKVNILFNNAGVAIAGPVWEMQHEDWEWLLRVNLWGVIHGVEAFLPQMLESGEPGHIVNTASFAGLVPNDGLSVYCVTKYGVVALTECLARDLRGSNIGASVLCPMRVATNIDDSARNRPPELSGGRQSQPAAGQPRAMVGRVISAEEVAQRVLEGIRRGELYIHTHAEARPFIRRRFERIDQAFDALEPGGA
jgi:NAD(P)-dependent dehydrogenase (short-subunit alcohol dehydrogenase family)